MLPERRQLGPLRALATAWIAAAAALVLSAPAVRADEWRMTPNFQAPAVNQLKISGNACGPAALLTSFRTGNDTWRRGLDLVPGENDRQQLGLWIRTYGLRPSETLRGRNRWTNAGINTEDLLAAANEMTRASYLPQLGQEDLFMRPRENPSTLAKRLHGRLLISLKKGVPPVLSLRRFVFRQGQWIPVQGHFVTVIGIQGIFPKGQSGFAFRYLDPWGGRPSQGVFQAPLRPVMARPDGISSCLEAVVPDANIGRKEVRGRELTVVIPTAIIARW